MHGMLNSLLQYVPVIFIFYFSTDNRYRQQVQTTGTDNGYRQRVQTTGTDNGYRQRVQTTGTDNGYRQRVQTTGTDNGYRKQVQQVRDFNTCIKLLYFGPTTDGPESGSHSSAGLCDSLTRCHTCTCRSTHMISTVHVYELFKIN